MRDFKAGHDINVGGSLHIHDETSQPNKLLTQCTNDELYDEQVHRKVVLSGERKSKLKRFFVVWLIPELGIAGFALWYYMHGNTNLSELILGLGSLVLAYPFVETFARRNPIEQRQTDALHEIDMILRERDARPIKLRIDSKLLIGVIGAALIMVSVVYEILFFTVPSFRLAIVDYLMADSDPLGIILAKPIVVITSFASGLLPAVFGGTVMRFMR